MRDNLKKMIEEMEQNSKKEQNNSKNDELGKATDYILKKVGTDIAGMAAISSFADGIDPRKSMRIMVSMLCSLYLSKTITFKEE